MNDQQTERLRTAGISRWDAAAFQVFAVIAALAGVLAVVGAVVGLGAVLGDSPVVQLRLAEPIEAAVTVPGGNAEPIDELLVAASGIGAGTRAILAAAVALDALVWATVAAAVALFLWRMAQGRPFHRTLFTSTLLAGAAMAIGGMLVEFGFGFGAMQAAFDLDPAGDTFVPGFTFEPATIATGAVVLALAFAFRAGSRLQRETEGLV